MTATTVRTQLDGDNPWPGLESFQENAHAFFFGRDHETESLLTRVLDAPVTVLYGRSGLGKTSLLQAGLFPMLRDRDFLPVYVRFQLKPDAAPLTTQLLTSAYESIRTEVPDAPSPSGDESLWEYLHRKDFELWSRSNYPLTPVLVLDQFEELFTLGERVPDLVDEFRNALGDLVENRIPSDLAARIDENAGVADQFDLRARNYKLLVSLREDFLADLDGWTRLIPALGRSRIRLLPLRAQQALDAVRRPAGDLMTKDLARRVVDVIDGEDAPSGNDAVAPTIAGFDGSGAGSEVEPALLSLFCRELNEERKRRGLEHFDEALVEDAKRDILSNYYRSCVGSLPPRVAEFIEMELITEKGFRDSYIREDAVPSHLTEDELTQLVSCRLLRLEERYGAQRIELTHDVLTGVVRENRDRRRADEEKGALAAHAERERQALKTAAVLQEAKLVREQRVTRRLRWFSAVLALACVASLVLAVITWRSLQAVERAKQAVADSSHEVLAERLTAQAQAILAGGQPGTELEAIDKLVAAQSLSVNPNIGALITTLRNEARLQKLVPVAQGSILSGDGRRIAQKSAFEIEVLDAETGRVVGQPIDRDDTLESITFDGRYVATSSADNTIRVWDANTGQAVSHPIRGLEESVVRVVLSPDGQRAVTTDGKFDSFLWDTETGRKIGGPLSDTKHFMTAAVFGPDGTRLATAGDNRNVRLWDSHNGALLSETIPVGDPNLGFLEEVESLAFSPDGRLIAAGGMTTGIGTQLTAGMPVRVWNVDTGEVVGHPEVGNYGRVDAVAFSPDGSTLVTGGTDKTIREWDVRTGHPVDPPLKLQAETRHVAFTRDGKRIIALSADTASVLNADPEGMVASELLGSRTIHAAPMGTMYGLDLSTDQPLVRLLNDGVLGTFDAYSGEQIGETASDALRGVTQFAWSDDQKWVAAVGEGNELRVLDISTGRLLGTPIHASDESIDQVQMSPNGRIVATGGMDHMVRLWDWQGGREIGLPLRGHTSSVNQIFFSDDGRRLYSRSYDSIRVWDVPSGRPIGTPIDTKFAGTRLALSPDRQRIAAAQQVTGKSQWVIRQWDAESGEALGTPPMTGHDDTVSDIAYSLDGEYLVSVSTDNTLRFWDPDTGRQVGEPIEISSIGKAAFVDFSHDGRRVFVIAQGLSMDGKPPYIGGGAWQLPAPASWKDTLCDKLAFNPTDQQWRDWISPDVPHTELCPGKPTG